MTEQRPHLRQLAEEVAALSIPPIIENSLASMRMWDGIASGSISLAKPPVIRINGDEGNLIVAIHPDGRIALGPAVGTDEAAREFWAAVERMAGSAPQTPAVPESGQQDTIGNQLDQLNLTPDLEDGEQIFSAIVMATLSRQLPDGSTRFRTVALAPANANRLGLGALLEQGSERARERLRGVVATEPPPHEIEHAPDHADAQPQDTDGIRCVLIKPSDVLLIGNLGEVNEHLMQTLLAFKDAVGLRNVGVFAADIDISSIDTEELAAQRNTAPRHGTGDCYPYGGSWDEGRDYTITCYCGAELTGETDGSVEAALEAHIAREEANRA